MTLRCYNGETIPLLSQTSVNVSHNGAKYKLQLLAVKGNKPALLGGDWFNVIKLHWKEIFHVHKTKYEMKGDQNSINSVVKRYQKGFSSKNAGIKGFEAKVNIKAYVSPV